LLRKTLERLIQEVTEDPVITSRRMRWAGYVARIGRRELHRVFMGKTEENRALGRPWRTCGYNIQKVLKK
jgi:hypothetical protein